MHVHHSAVILFGIFQKIKQQLGKCSNDTWVGYL
jgi:hypothetical protein